MATYEVETDNGVFEVEVDDAPQAPQYQPSGLEQAAEVSQGVQDAVMQSAGKMLEMAPYPIRKSAEAAGAIVAPIAQGIEAAGGYAAEKLGQTGVNPYVAGAIGTAAANLPYLAVPTAKVGALPGASVAARRTVFGKQNLLKKIPGGVPQAEEIGMEMLNKGVIGPFASKETMLGRAQSLADKAGAKVGQIPTALDAVAKRGMDATVVADEVAKQLQPKLQKGAFKTDVNTMNEIIETIKAAGPEATFDQAQTIKQKLQQLGQFPKGQVVDQAAAEKIRMYRRASGIFNDAMEKAINKESPAMGTAYKKAKGEYGPAASAVNGLSDAYITEAANVVPTLRGTISGAEAMGRGEFGKAAMLVAGYDLAARKGAQMAAYTLGKAIPSTVFSKPAQKAAYAQFISRITEK